MTKQLQIHVCHVKILVMVTMMLFSSLEIGFRTDTILHFLRGIISHQTTHKKINGIKVQITVV